MNHSLSFINDIIIPGSIIVAQILAIITEETPLDPLTPEESAIRWATQHGRTINI